MNCSSTELFLIAGFFVSLLLANISSWRMQKLASLVNYNGPRWKLWFGDVALPDNTVGHSGRFWRKVSIWSFLLLVFFGTTIGYLNLHGSICFGINS
jgi:hypothetical protein